jgi:hypothetical protein
MGAEATATVIVRVTELNTRKPPVRYRPTLVIAVAAPEGLH